MKKIKRPVFTGDIKTPYMGLTEEQFKRFSGACHRTWQAIAPDIFAVEGVGDSIPRSHVIELTLDADRMRVYGTGFGCPTPEWSAFYDETIRPWLDVVYHLPRFKRLMAKEVFPYGRYE